MKITLTVLAVLVAAPAYADGLADLGLADPVVTAPECRILAGLLPCHVPTGRVNDGGGGGGGIPASNDPGGPTKPDVPDHPDRPTKPTKPDAPTKPGKPERVKGNNGWGNGDQAAPGKSRDRNNAENSNRSQRNHGQANKN